MRSTQHKHHFTKSKPNRCKILLSCCVCITVSIYISVLVLEYTNNLTTYPSDLNHNTAKLGLKEVHEWNYTSIDDRLQRLMIERNTINPPICDYMAVKGLPFSGTNWLKYILKLIATHICNSTKLNQAASLCIPLQFDANECKTCPKPHNHIGEWYKFKKTDISPRIDPTLKNKEYIAIQRLIQRDKNIRFCHFIVLRDPRDAIISNIYGRYYRSYYGKMFLKSKPQLNLSKDAAGDLKRGIVKNDKSHSQSKTKIAEFTTNNMIYQNFIDDVQTLNEWWKFYKFREDQSPQLYFTYFYEDLVHDPVTVIKNMLIYVGVYPNIVGDVEMENIVAASKFNQMVTDGVFAMQRNGKYCNFTNAENKILEDTVDFMNIDMTQNMLRELLYKFNQNCVVYTTNQ